MIEMIPIGTEVEFDLIRHSGRSYNKPIRTRGRILDSKRISPEVIFYGVCLEAQASQIVLTNNQLKPVSI